MYVSGLELLQKALNSPRARLEDETLAACLTLSLYELSEATSGMKDAYVAHRKGAMMLLESRGPEACTTPLGHSLFLAIRAQTVSDAFVLLDPRGMILLMSLSRSPPVLHITLILSSPTTNGSRYLGS
jgi:hypothetical protein